MSCADAGFGGVQRFEVFTGAGGRRRWTRQEKAAIIAESYAGVESVCAVANRHGLRHTQLFTWRREMRRAAEAAGVMLPVTIAPEPLFVPALIELEPVAVSVAVPAPTKKRSRELCGKLAADIASPGSVDTEAPPRSPRQSVASGRYRRPSRRYASGWRLSIPRS